MAGLNFQTQTIINANVDRDSNSVELFKATTEKIDGVEKTVLKVKRDFLFDKDNVKVIRKRAGYEAEACEVNIDFSKIEAIQPTTDEPKKYCRLDIYLGVEGAEPFIYATPWVQKGMPFWVEFTVNSNNKSKIAEEIAKDIKKNHLFLVDKDLLSVEAKGNVLTLTGNTEYQRFRNIEVSTFNVTDDYAEVVASMEDAAVSLVNRGKNGFGTYANIVKDLRLPTAANYQWTHIRQAETPIIGAIYNQYIIEYCAPANNDGMQAVGQRMESHTTHVFWVKNDIASEWEAELAEIGTINDVDAVSTAETGLDD